MSNQVCANTSKQKIKSENPEELERIIKEKREARRLKKQLQQEETQSDKPPVELILRPMAEISLNDAIDHHNKRKFTLMTYNLLAQSLCRRELFPDCGDAIRWKNRRSGLIKEILNYSPDVACFQEMDSSNLVDTFRPEFEKSGYEMLYFQGSAKKRHGCCIMWKKSKFTKLKERTIEYDLIGCPSTKTLCVGIAIALAFKNEEDNTIETDNVKKNNGIIIGTTHLYWRPQCMYERGRQISILAGNLIDMNKEFGFNIFFAGDLNTLPTDPTYKLLAHPNCALTPEEISLLENSMKTFNESEDEVFHEESIPSSSSSNPDSTTNSNEGIKQLRVSELLSRFATIPKSVSLYAKYYKEIEQGNPEIFGEPKFTCYGHWFKGTLDYIFMMDYQENLFRNIKITKILKMPEEKDFSPALPNLRFNSDHLCLMVELIIFSRSSPYLNQLLFSQSLNFSTTSPTFRLKLPDKKLPGKVRIPKDAHFMSAKVQQLATNGKLEEAINFVIDAPKHAVSEVVWNHLIAECVKIGKVKMGFRLFTEMKRRGFPPNEQTYTILLNGIAEKRTFANNIAYAINVIDNMRTSARENAIRPNVIHGNALLKVCSRSQDFQSLRENYDRLFGSGELYPNTDTFTIVFGSCARNGVEGFKFASVLWEELMGILERQRQRDGYTAGKVEYEGRFGILGMDDQLAASMLLCCKNAGETEKGYEIIEEIYGIKLSGSSLYVSKPSRYDVEMTSKSLDVALGLCFKGRDWSKGIHLFDQVLAKYPRIELDIYNMNTLISLYIEARNLKSAINIFETIRAQKITPVLQTYDLLLTACRIVNDWGSATKIFEDMLRMKLMPDAHILNLMLELANGRKSRGINQICWLLERIEVLGLNTSMKKNSKLPVKIENVNFLQAIIKAYSLALERADDELLDQKLEAWTFLKNFYEKKLENLLKKQGEKEEVEQGKLTEKTRRSKTRILR
ncbi:8863_t:CDS:2 [Ambispora leptoticha]|uniref:8863_t:CDS:1 n=1 Tax=Ambispora leptoticha TaxID=144679 RepID=A0A9N8WDR3_9GLOM|nr:8863_t:CDS:2 [Ambispora leptoticha]